MIGEKARYFLQCKADAHAAADGIVSRIQIGWQGGLERPEFVPARGVQGDDAVEWSAEDELAGGQDRCHFEGTASESCAMPRAASPV